MGNFRDRAREVKAKGVEERGNWQPRPGSVPLKMYQYWVDNTAADVPKNENFCHYWRVVALWAPILWAFEKIYDFVNDPKGQVILGLVYATAVAVLWNTAGLAGVAVGMLFGPWTALGFITGLVVGVEQTRGPVWTALAILTLPVSIIPIGIAAVYRWWPAWMTTLTQRFLASVAAVVLLVLGYMVAQEATLRGTLIALGILVVAVALVAGVASLVTYITGRRALIAEREREEYYSSFLDGTYVEPEPDEPGRIRRFFSGIADLLIFAAQVVRVKKWKICPIVQIPNEDA